MSVRQSLGKVAVVPKGSWDGTKTYEFLDIVKSGGGSYIARQDVPIGIAITNTEYWVSLVDKGDPGDSAIVPAYIDTDVIRYLNDHGTHATDDIYTSLLMREDVDSGVLPFIVRPTGSDSTTEEYFELDHQIHSADSPVIHFRSREHLLAVDSTGHFTMTDRPQIDSVNGKTGAVVLDASDVGALPADTPIPAAVTEQTVANWGFTKNAVRYDEQMALSDTQKATARTNIGAVGKLEYDALESDIESLEADLSLKLDAADAPTKVSDLTNDTGYITASQVPAAPVQSVNGKTGAVTVNEVPDASGASVGQVLSKTENGLGWTTPSGGGGGAASLIISLYLNSQTGVYTCSASPTQLYNALPNCALAAAEHTIPVTDYKKDGANYVTAVFVDPAYENDKLSAIVWTLTAATSSSTVTVTREEVAVDGVPDSTSATVGQVLTKTASGFGWANNNPSSGAALRLLYDGAFGPDDPDLMLMGNVANTETGNAIATALYTGRIGSAVLVDVSNSNTEVVYDLFAVDYDAQTHVSTVTFARTEADCIRTATLSGSTKSAPTFGTIPLGGLPAVTEQTVANWGFTKNTGTYSKPSGGIPKSDLAPDVQTSLGKADTALQEHQSLSGYATETYVQQQIAAIPAELPAVTASDNGKFLRVVSGAWAAQAVPFQTTRVAMTSTDTTPTLDPNKLYVFPEMASLAITLATPADNTIVNEYHFIFTSGATATTLTLPAAVLQPDGFTVEANHVYEVSILENCMTAQGWAVTA